MQKYGAKAIPGLVKLLESDSRNARELAGYTLRDIKGLTPEHLPALMKARRNGDGWIPPAIARVGTPEAVMFLVDDLRHDPETHTQVTGALEMLGAKAAPALAEFFACAERCDEERFRAASSVLGEMKEQAVGVIPRLLQIAQDQQFEPQGRRYAVMTIGSLGHDAESFVPQLNELKKQDPSLSTAVEMSLTSIGSPDAVPALLRQLPIHPEDALYSISGLLKNGYSAGPAVMKYLDDRRWDVRVAAVNTLGDIGYLPAEPALAEMLTNVDDWKLVYSTVLALGHLRAKGSLAHSSTFMSRIGIRRCAALRPPWSPTSNPEPPWLNPTRGNSVSSRAVPNPAIPCVSGPSRNRKGRRCTRKKVKGT